MDKNKDLELARTKYLNILDSLTKGDNSGDPKYAAVALKCIDGIVNIAKINSDNNNASALADVLKNSINTISAHNREAEKSENKNIPELPNDLEEPTILPGELDPLTPV